MAVHARAAEAAEADAMSSRAQVAPSSQMPPVRGCPGSVHHWWEGMRLFVPSCVLWQPLRQPCSASFC